MDLEAVWSEWPPFESAGAGVRLAGPPTKSRPRAKAHVSIAQLAGCSATPASSRRRRVSRAMRSRSPRPPAIVNSATTPCRTAVTRTAISSRSLPDKSRRIASTRRGLLTKSVPRSTTILRRTSRTSSFIFAMPESESVRAPSMRVAEVWGRIEASGGRPTRGTRLPGCRLGKMTTKMPVAACSA